MPDTRSARSIRRDMIQDMHARRSDDLLFDAMLSSIRPGNESSHSHHCRRRRTTTTRRTGGCLPLSNPLPISRDEHEPNATDAVSRQEWMRTTHTQTRQSMAPPNHVLLRGQPRSSLCTNPAKAGNPPIPIPARGCNLAGTVHCTSFIHSKAMTPMRQNFYTPILPCNGQTLGVLTRRNACRR
jgi:hypothetical protein